MELHIDHDVLAHQLETLGRFSDAPAPAVTRVVFTQADIGARNYVKDLCFSAGLDVHEDPVGNTFARWAGEYSNQAAVATGSHVDAIPNAGRFDGTVGVIGGLEAIRALQRSGFYPKRPIELIIFTSEEPTRFGIGCLGSRLLSGSLEPSVDGELRDKSGKTLCEVRQQAGFAGNLDDVRRRRGHYSSFVELHIEQGPLLERERLAIGVVTAIAGPATLRILIEGQGGHAGGVLMPDRQDALCAAAEIILAVESSAKSGGAVDTVATTGVCDVFPSAVNSIPSRVELLVDVRDIDEARRERVLASIRQAKEEVSSKRNVRMQVETLNADAPGTCDPMVVEAIARGCSSLRLPFKKMVSRAYHDSLFMSRIAPTGMIFIPCRGGVSHRPDEFASPEAIANGTAVLARVLAELAS